MLHKRIDKHINDDGSRSNDYIISSIPLINNSNKSFINTKPFYSTSIPLACIGALVLLGLASINPSSIIANNLIGSSDGSVYAEEVTSTGTAISLSIDGINGGSGGGTINSSINAQNGDTAYISHNVTVNGSNIDSYSLQITAASNSTSELQHDGNAFTIAGAGGVRGVEMAKNTWGYSWGNTNDTVSDLHYYTLPAYGTTSTSINTGLLEAANISGDVSFTKKLTFGARFLDAPSGHYTTTALLSLAASPQELGKTWSELTTMQDMNPNACKQAPLNTPKTLTDTRDGSTYTIARIKNQTNDDALCWMTQNLRLVDYNLTQADSDVTTDFYLPASIALSSSDNPKKFSTSDVYEPTVYYAGNTSYGAYYNWFTATAETGNNNFSTGNAPSSICPKGWRLPSGNDNGEFYQLLSGITQSNKSPYNFVYGDGFLNSAPIGYNFGYYWTSTADYPDTAQSVTLGSGAAPSIKSGVRYFGYYVRCVAR